jgi:hypothetical protein
VLKGSERLLRDRGRSSSAPPLVRFVRDALDVVRLAFDTLTRFSRSPGEASYPYTTLRAQCTAASFVTDNGQAGALDSSAMLGI